MTRLTTIEAIPASVRVGSECTAHHALEYSKMARRASVQVAQEDRYTSSVLSVAEKVSATAPVLVQAWSKR